MSIKKVTMGIILDRIEQQKRIHVAYPTQFDEDSQPIPKFWDQSLVDFVAAVVVCTTHNIVYTSAIQLSLVHTQGPMISDKLWIQCKGFAQNCIYMKKIDIHDLKFVDSITLLLHHSDLANHIYKLMVGLSWLSSYWTLPIN